MGESGADADVVGDALSPNEVSGRMAPERAAELWRLLPGHDETDDAGVTPSDDHDDAGLGAGPELPASEVAARMARAWEAATGDTAPTASPSWDEPAGWAFEPLPERGGVLEMFLRRGSAARDGGPRSQPVVRQT
jgi:hypothetical protein